MHSSSISVHARRNTVSIEHSIFIRLIIDVVLLSIYVGELKVIHGQGMPSQRHHEPGDLYVKISVKFPDSIDPSAIPLLERALPPRKPVEKFDKNVILEEVTLDDADTRSRPGLQDDAMDEDQEEPRVQCANQ
jgi:DnaJ family protein A protein 2